MSPGPSSSSTMRCRRIRACSRPTSCWARRRLRNGDPAGAETSFEKALQAWRRPGGIGAAAGAGLCGPGQVRCVARAHLARGAAAAEPGRDTHPARQRAGGHGQADPMRMRSLDEARALDPQSVAVRLALVNVLLRTGDKARATSRGSTKSSSSPQTIRPYGICALRWHTSTGNLPAALADYAKAIALDSRQRGCAGRASRNPARPRPAGRGRPRRLPNLQRVSPRRAARDLPAGGRRRAARTTPMPVRKALTDAVGLLDPVPKEGAGPATASCCCWAACRTMVWGTWRRPAEYLVGLREAQPEARRDRANCWRASTSTVAIRRGRSNCWSRCRRSRPTIRNCCRCWRRRTWRNGGTARPRPCSSGRVKVVRRHAGPSRRFRGQPDRKRAGGPRIQSVAAGVRQGSRPGARRRRAGDAVPQARPTEKGARGDRRGRAARSQERRCRQPAGRRAGGGGRPGRGPCRV